MSAAADSVIADRWRQLALAPPFALGGPLARALLKDSAADFEVRERLKFAADGGKEHLLLEVRKTGRDTLSVARALARHAGVAAREVGFAGLKDRVAVTTQWFSVPARLSRDAWAGVAGPGFEVLAVEPHSRKLRRGALAGNGFRIVLRDFHVAPEVLAARLAAIELRGVPNYFGAQRFGRGGSNLEAIARWCEGRALPVAREPRAFVYSAARALVFNALLAARVLDGSWERVLAGEFVNLDGRNSYFVATEPDATLAARLLLHDIHPTGPLPGAGEHPGQAVGALEAEIEASFGGLTGLLAGAGLEAARRPLRVRPQNLKAVAAGALLTLEFDLPSGAYATALVRELAASAPLELEVDDA